MPCRAEPGGDRLGRTTVETLLTTSVDEVFSTYGLTEAGPRVATNHLVAGGADWDTLGSPLADVRLRVAPSTDGPGELLVTTPTAQAGQYRDGAFVPWPQGCEVPTGDLARIDGEGRIRLVGRARRVAVVKGEKVYLGLVERVLAAHPWVRDAHVAADDDGVLSARVLPTAAGGVAPADLARWCRGRLRAVEVPQRFVEVDADTQLTK